MAAGLGFEPRQTDPESAVLPLHHPAKKRRLSALLAFRLNVRLGKVKPGIAGRRCRPGAAGFLLNQPAVFPA